MKISISICYQRDSRQRWYPRKEVWIHLSESRGGSVMDHPDQEGILILKHKASHSISFTQSFMQGKYWQGQRAQGQGGQGNAGHYRAILCPVPYRATIWTLTPSFPGARGMVVRSQRSYPLWYHLWANVAGQRWSQCCQHSYRAQGKHMAKWNLAHY